MLTKTELKELCRLLPGDVNWGDSITPEIVGHINQAVISAVEAKLREQEPVGVVSLQHNMDCIVGSNYHTAVSPHRSVTFFKEVELGKPLFEHPRPTPDIESKYNELLMAVCKKFLNEARHETALKYIRRMEELPETAAQQSGGVK